MLREQGFCYDAVRAVLARSKDDPYRVKLLAAELQELLTQRDASRAEQFKLATQAVLRCQCIVDFAIKREIRLSGEIDPSLLQETEEQLLASELALLYQRLQKNGNATLKGRYAELDKLAPRIAAFFEKVMVMVDDTKLRENRLLLAEKVANIVTDLADLRELEGFQERIISAPARVALVVVVLAHKP